jgi:hypothetical protein
MNALDPTVAEWPQAPAHREEAAPERHDGATADDPSAFFENLFELAHYYGPPSGTGPSRYRCEPCLRGVGRGMATAGESTSTMTCLCSTFRAACSPLRRSGPDALSRRLRL